MHRLDQLERIGRLEEVVSILIQRIGRGTYFPDAEREVLQAFVDEVECKPTRIWGAE